MHLVHTLIWLVTVSALSISVKVGNELFLKGKLVQDETWTFLPAQESALSNNGYACAGISDDKGNFECQHQFELSGEPWDSFKVFVDETGKPRVNAQPGPLSAQFSFPVTVSRPTPKEPEVIIAGQGYEQPKEDDRNLLQKYWYFLIPLAILFATGNKQS